MSYDNEKKFALFRNDKGDNPKRPDYRGAITVNGLTYKMSAWLTKDKKGQTYMRGVVEIDERAAQPAPAPAQPTQGKVVDVPSPRPVQRDLTGAPIPENVDDIF